MSAMIASIQAVEMCPGQSFDNAEITCSTHKLKSQISLASLAVS